MSPTGPAHPCHSDGSKITTIENSSVARDFGDDVRAEHTFSARVDYRDYRHKMTSDIARIAGEAHKLDDSVCARTYPAIPADGDTCVFRYVDTATIRAGIGAVNGGFRISLRSIQNIGLFRTCRSPVSPKQGILIEAVGPEPRFMPVAVLLADERAVLSRWLAEARVERPAKLTHAGKAAALGDIRQ